MRFKSLIPVVIAVASLGSATSAPAADTVENAVARLRLCNPQVRAYCEETDEGSTYGLIEIPSESDRMAPVRLGGENSTDAAMLSGHLTAFIILEHDAHRDEDFYFSAPIRVSGEYGTDELTGERVFRMTTFTQN